MQLGNTSLAIIALIPLYGFGIGLHLELIDTGEMFHLENIVKTADVDFKSNSLFSDAFMSTDVEGIIQHASISLNLVNVLVDPSIEEPNSGDEYFDNLINECTFHSDESIEGNTCVLCKLVDPEIEDVIAKGIIELPDGYQASDKVTIEFDEPADVMESKGIKIKVVQNDIGIVEPSSGDIIADDNTDAIIKVDPVTITQTIISQDVEFHNLENVVVDSNGGTFASTQEAFAQITHEVTVTKSVDKSVVLAGTQVVYSYSIQNTGTSNIFRCSTLFDSELGQITGFASGPLASGETATLIQSGSITINSDTTNTATVTCLAGNESTIMDTSNQVLVDVVNPSATIDKTSNNDGSLTGVDPLQVVSGTNVFSVYKVTRGGDVALNNCQVRDDNATPTNLGDDFDVGSPFNLANNGDMATVLFGPTVVNADRINTGSVTCDVATTMVDSFGPITDTAFVDVVEQRTCEEIFAMDG